MSTSTKKAAPVSEKPTYSSVKDDPYLVVKTIVGEVMPVAQDVYTLRARCFPPPPTLLPTHSLPVSSSSGAVTSSTLPPPPLPTNPFRENADATALHVVAYLNLTALEAYMEQYAEFSKARASVGLTDLRFQHQMPDPPAVYIEEAKRLLAERALTSAPSTSRPQTAAVPAHIAAAVADGAVLTRPPKTATDTEAAKKAPASSARPRYVPPRLHPIGALRLRRVSRCPYLGRFHMMIATVEWQCVLAPYRNTGVGGSLVAMAERAVSDAFHVPYVYLLAPVSARTFYENLGYVAQLVPPSSNDDAKNSRASTTTSTSSPMVRPCLTNMAQCIAAGYTPRVVDVCGELHLVMGKSLTPVKDPADPTTTKSNL